MAGDQAFRMWCLLFVAVIAQKDISLVRGHKNRSSGKESLKVLMVVREKSSYPRELRQGPLLCVSRSEGSGRGLVLCGAGCQGPHPGLHALPSHSCSRCPRGARHKDTEGLGASTTTPGYAVTQGRGVNSFLISNTHGITLPLTGKRPNALCNVLPKTST